MKFVFSTFGGYSVMNPKWSHYSVLLPYFISLASCALLASKSNLTLILRLLVNPRAVIAEVKY